MKYDIIGDIHGHAVKLEELLIKLGYEIQKGVYFCEGRTAIFVGDFIDRGTQNKRVIEVVRNMVDHGSAYTVMGNHEYNAICYHMRKPDSKYDWYRPHTKSKFKQHENFLKEYPLEDPATIEVIDWFKTLPIFLNENFPFRIIHACWDNTSIDLLQKHLNSDNSLNEAHFPTGAEEGTDLFKIFEKLLKGPEIVLPDGVSFFDKDGKQRDCIRVKWWGDTDGLCRDIAFGYTEEELETFPNIKPVISTDHPSYSEKEKPVFFGHYWQTGKPVLQQKNLCCVDYSAGNGGGLICYTFDTEERSSQLKITNFI